MSNRNPGDVTPLLRASEALVRRMGCRRAFSSLYCQGNRFRSEKGNTTAYEPALRSALVPVGSFSATDFYMRGTLMKVSVGFRTLSMVVAAGTLVAVPLAVPASAAAESASCSTVSTVLKAGKITATFTKCTPTSLATGGTATFTNPPTGSTKGTLKLTLTWKGGKGTTLALVSFKAAANPGKCPKGDTLEAVTGTVSKGGTGAAAKLIKVGEKVTSSTCAVTTGPKLGSSTLEPGTLFKL